MPHPRPPPRPSPTGRTLRSRPRSRSPTTPTPWTTGTTGSRLPPAAFCIYITFPCRAVVAGGRIAAESNKVAEFLSCSGKEWGRSQSSGAKKTICRCSSVLNKKRVCRRLAISFHHTTTTTTTTTATGAALLLLLLSSCRCVRMFN